MKAIRMREFGPPEVLRLEDVADPKPGAGQVVVRIHAAGVNPVETYIRSGTYALKPPLPYTPGGDAAGVVVAVGEQVTRFKAGDRVYTAGTVSGAYAQLALCAAEQVYPLPDQITSHRERACIYPMPPPTAHFFSAPTRMPVRPCWCTEHRAPWESPRCSLPRPPD